MRKRRNLVVDIHPLLDDLLIVRDQIEAARVATDSQAQQTALRIAHAAISKTERDLYQVFGVPSGVVPSM